MIQLGKFEGGGVVDDTNYLYPARWGWINEDLELDFGRNFKYQLHPEEKLSLAFLDWTCELWLFLKQIFFELIILVLAFQQTIILYCNCVDYPCINYHFFI